MRENIHAILNKELSRRDFIKILGGTFIMLFGVQNFISFLAVKTGVSPVQHQQVDSRHGFGSRKFGR